MPSANPSAIVIVGAGQAGVRAAEVLRTAQFMGSITVIGGEARPLYEQPQLSKSILLDHAAALVCLCSPQEWSALEVDIFIAMNATACDHDGRAVGLADGRECRFDRPLLATGTQGRRLHSLEEGQVLVRYLRSVDDALRLRESLQEGRGSFLSEVMLSDWRSQGVPSSADIP